MKSVIWHPFTQHGLGMELPCIAKAQGAYLFDENGKAYLDAISSWWVTTHGHCHPRIQAAICKEAETLDQIIFANFTHPRAEELAQRLVQITPDGLDHVFFSDSGSTSVEVAIKMAMSYWTFTGRPRRRLMVMEHSYHGDTVGAMSLGSRGVFNEPYEPLLFDVETLPFPLPGRERQTLDALEAACGDADGPLAALIVEPLVLGAGGMLMYGADTLREMKRICEKSGVLFIVDEVMTAWGRTGSLFACKQAGIVPDVACYAKGITGGALPLAVTMCSREIYDAHYSTDRKKTFFHSSSYTANPIACAAAVENLNIWRDEPVMERIDMIAGCHRNFANRADLPENLVGIRHTGTILAMDVAAQPGYLSDVGLFICRYAMERGALIRPIGNTVYLMPPYCVTGAELERLYQIIQDAAEAWEKA